MRNSAKPKNSSEGTFQAVNGGTLVTRKVIVVTSGDPYFVIILSEKRGPLENKSIYKPECISQEIGVNLTSFYCTFRQELLNFRTISELAHTWRRL